MNEPAALTRIVRRAQAGLNRLHLAARIMRGVACTGAAAGSALLIARLLGLSWAAVSIYAVFLALGGLAGAVTGWRGRYDRAQAAFWLDRQLHLAEVLSAALVCLARDCRGRFDEEVVARAERCSYPGTRLNWPWKAAAGWSGAAAGIVILFTVALSIVKPLDFPAAGEGLRKPGAAWQSGERAGRARAAASITAEEIARAIFPGNTWLAQRLSQALAMGDADNVRYLLAQARQEMDAEIQAAATPEQRQRIEVEQRRRRQAAANLANEDRETGASGDDPGAGADGLTGDEDSGGQEDWNGAGGKTGRSGNRQAMPGFAPGLNAAEEGGPEGPSETDDYDAASQGGQGGNRAGQGAGGKGPGGPVSAKSGKTEAPLDQGQSQVYEYILPGSNVRAPLSRAVADSGRAAEGAIGRAGLPGEYAEFIRHYFLLLARAAGAAEGGKRDE